MKRWWAGRVRVIFGILVWAAVLAAVVVSWDDVRDALSGLEYLFPLAVVLIAAGIVAGSRGWVELQPEAARSRSMTAFIAAQPAKYLPLGGAAQAASQIGFTSTVGSSRVDVAWNFLIYLLLQVTAGMVISLTLLANDEVAAWVKAGTLAATVVLVTATYRPVLSWAIERIARISSRVRRNGSVPEERSILRALLWSIVPVLISGTLFGILLHGLNDWRSILTALGVFALAWVFGLVLFPFPSGIGAREAALIYLLPSMPGAQVLGVSLVHRFATLVAEILLLAVISRSAFGKRSEP